mgnify:CR=1 FL=1
MLKNIIFIFIVMVIIFGSFLFIDLFNINLNTIEEKRLVKTINLET